MIGLSTRLSLMISLDGVMDEISLTQKFVNFFLLMGGLFAVFYALIYSALWLGVAVLGMLVKQPDVD